ncbi:MAG: hypothetical protein OEQ14_17375 [Gammaproteobacteria bacterium]|nr:hypothetical protein [Gammaproteobacteria bacterium]
MDNKPDMPVPTTDTNLVEGNLVILRCSDFAVLLAVILPGDTR